MEQDECTEEDIRKAYLSLAKKYHPDSRTMEADSDQFISVSPHCTVVWLTSPPVENRVNQFVGMHPMGRVLWILINHE